MFVVSVSNVVNQLQSSLQLKQLVKNLNELPKKIAENLKKKPLFVYFLSEVTSFSQPLHALEHCVVDSHCYGNHHYGNMFASLHVT